MAHLERLVELQRAERVTEKAPGAIEVQRAGVALAHNGDQRRVGIYDLGAAEFDRSRCAADDHCLSGNSCDVDGVASSARVSAKQVSTVADRAVKCSS